MNRMFEFKKLSPELEEVLMAELHTLKGGTGGSSDPTYDGGDLEEVVITPPDDPGDDNDDYQDPAPDPHENDDDGGNNGENDYDEDYWNHDGNGGETGGDDPSEE